MNVEHTPTHSRSQTRCRSTGTGIEDQAKLHSLRA